MGFRDVHANTAWIICADTHTHPLACTKETVALRVSRVHARNGGGDGGY